MEYLVASQQQPLLTNWQARIRHGGFPAALLEEQRFGFSLEMEIFTP